MQTTHIAAPHTEPFTIRDGRRNHGPVPAKLRKYWDVISAAPVGIAYFNRDRRIIAVNERWCEAIRPSGVGVTGATIFELLPDGTDCWKSAQDEALNGTRVEREVVTIRRPDGWYVTANHVLVPISQRQSTISGYVWMIEVLRVSSRAGREILIAQEDDLLSWSFLKERSGMPHASFAS